MEGVIHDGRVWGPSVLVTVAAELYSALFKAIDRARREEQGRYH